MGPVAGGVRAGSGALPGQGRARITVRPGRRPVRGRTPFAVLVVVLLAAGLLGLLALNTALNEGSFELSRLQKQTTVLTDEQQGLQHQIDQSSAPDALAKRAAGLGMIPSGGMAFLDVQNGGKVLGKPGPAQDSPPVKRSTVEPWPMKQQPSPSAQQSAPAPTATAGDSVVQINPGAPAASPAASAPTGGAAR